MNVMWTLIIAIAVLYALPQGHEGARAITDGIVHGAEQSVAFAFGLIGILAFWSGMLRLAERSGITDWIARRLAPVIRILFPSIPPDHPANASLMMALSANLLGLGNAATPLGLKAMKDLATLNDNSNEASDAMCTFLALSTSSITLIPGTVIAVRAAAGSALPTAVVASTIMASAVSTTVAVILDRWFRKTYRPRGDGEHR